MCVKAMPFEVHLIPRMCYHSCVMQTQFSCFGFGHKNRILSDMDSVTSLLDSVTFGQNSHNTLVSVHNKGGCYVNSSFPVAQKLLHNFAASHI